MSQPLSNSISSCSTSLAQPAGTLDTAPKDRLFLEQFEHRIDHLTAHVCNHSPSRHCPFVSACMYKMNTGHGAQQNAKSAPRH